MFGRLHFDAKFFGLDISYRRFKVTSWRSMYFLGHTPRKNMVRIVSHGMFFGGRYKLDLPPTKDAGLGWDSGRLQM